MQENNRDNLENTLEESCSDFIESAKKMISDELDDTNDSTNVVCPCDDDDDVKIADFSSGSDAPAATNKKIEKTRYFDKVPSSESVFLKSVMTFSSNDLKKKKKKKSSMSISASAIMRIAAFFVCIGVFAWSVMQIVQRGIDSETAKLTNSQTDDKMNEKDENGSGAIDIMSDTKLSELISLIFGDKQNSTSGDSSIKHTTTDKIAEQYGEELANDYRALRQNIINLKENNQDTFAYIRIADAGLHYAVMLKNDDKKNEYYLHHDTDGNEVKSGAIFADYKVNRDYDQNRNVVIYGHCMTDGTMFRPIKWLFDDKKGRQEKSEQWEIEIITEKSIYIYKVFSGYRSEGSRFIQNINKNKCSDKDFETFLKEIKQKSVFKNDIQYDGTSRIVTLSTCTNVRSKPNERYVLHGILTNVITF